MCIHEKAAILALTEGKEMSAIHSKICNRCGVSGSVIVWKGEYTGSGCVQKSCPECKGKGYNDLVKEVQP